MVYIHTLRRALAFFLGSASLILSRVSGPSSPGDGGDAMLSYWLSSCLSSMLSILDRGFVGLGPSLPDDESGSMIWGERSRGLRTGSKEC